MAGITDRKNRDIFKEDVLKISGVLGLQFVLSEFHGLCSGYSHYVDKMVEYGMALIDDVVHHRLIKRPYKKDELIKVSDKTYITDIPTTIVDILEYDLGNGCMVDEALFWLEEDEETIEKIREKIKERVMNLDYFEDFEEMLEGVKTMEH